jgi:hypothetical protein
MRLEALTVVLVFWDVTLHHNWVDLTFQGSTVSSSGIPSHPRQPESLAFLTFQQADLTPWGTNTITWIFKIFTWLTPQHPAVSYQLAYTVVLQITKCLVFILLTHFYKQDPF